MKKSENVTKEKRVKERYHMKYLIILIILISAGAVFLLFDIFAFGLYYLFINLKHRKCLNEYCQYLNENYASKANVTIKKINFSLSKSYNAAVLYRTKRISISNEYLYALEGVDNYYQKMQLLNTMGHEIAHMKNRDQYSEFFGIKNKNTDKMIHLLKEVRADIEGKLIINSSEEDYVKYRLVEEFMETKNRKSSFIAGYPTEELRTKYAMNYSLFSMLLIEEVFKDYSEYMGVIDKGTIYQYFGL